MPVRAFSQSGASSIHCSLEGMKEAFVSVEKTKISKRIQRFLVQRGGGGGRKGERKSQFSTESSSRVSKKAPEVADDLSLSLFLFLCPLARAREGRKREDGIQMAKELFGEKEEFARLRHVRHHNRASALRTTRTTRKRRRRRRRRAKGFCRRKDRGVHGVVHKFLSSV